MTQFMMDALPMSIVASLALAIVVAGCGGSAHARTFERCSRLGANCRPVSDAQARREAGSARAQWWREARAQTKPGWTSVPPHSRLVAQLRREAQRDGFRLESAAGVTRPVVVIESDDYDRVVRAIPGLVEDVHERSYPAFFLEAVDSRHVPYVAVFDSLRGHVMGGQWARADDLYPFAHG